MKNPYDSQSKVKEPKSMEDKSMYDKKSNMYDKRKYRKTSSGKFEPIDEYEVNGRRWFDSSGNTYHSVEVYKNGDLVGREDFEYGYGDQYRQTALKILKKTKDKNYGTDSENTYKEFSVSTYRPENVEIKFNVQDVQRKRDL